MTSIHEAVTKVRQKPEHVRRRIALGISSGVTGLVAVIWAGTLVSSGAFALNTGTDVTPTQEASLSGTNVESNLSQLAGAISSVTGATTSDPELTIIDGETSSSFKKTETTNPSATVIPF